MSRRAMLGAGVLIAWLAGVALLIRREYFRPQAERLAEAATRITPGAVYYGVMQGDRQVGFASSTIDTAQAELTVADYLVADLPVGGKARRATARTNVTLTRALRLKKFDLTLDTEGSPIRASGTVEGDTILVIRIASANDSGAPQRIPISGSVVLPTIVPLALALGEKPKVGSQYTLPVLDPMSMAARDIAFEVRAESSFVVYDSSQFNAATRKWRGVLPDTIHAWKIGNGATQPFGGWVDDQGRIVETSELGFTLKRLPYEVAFENWRNDSTHLAVSGDRDILETTAIAANKKLDSHLTSLTVRLSNVDLTGFDLNGGRQHFENGVLTIGALPDSLLVAKYLVPQGLNLDPANTRAEPLLESNDSRIRAQGYKIQWPRREPEKVAELLNTWVHDSVKDRITFGPPDALKVLETRVGDCNEHTQLYVALARSMGIPARIAAGLAYVDGKFYYHAWPEVYLRDWVAVDPTFGQFPADAAHLRFIV
ncbi:MAG TPA: transglutaminase-like domain-containing protein, partial [Gemmatimonadaceae bacterium]